MKSLKNKMQRAALKTRNVLANRSGDQMTGWLIVVLIVVVVGAVFMTLYQSSIRTSGTPSSPKVPPLSYYRRKDNTWKHAPPNPLKIKIKNFEV
jgi:hypothetical protein